MFLSSLQTQILTIKTILVQNKFSDNPKNLLPEPMNMNQINNPPLEKGLTQQSGLPEEYNKFDNNIDSQIQPNSKIKKPTKNN